MRVIVWFRGKDLRLRDNAALAEALKLTDDVVPLFVLDPYFFDPRRAANLPNRIQFLLDGLQDLERTISALGSNLLMVRGKSIDVVPKLVTALGAARVHASRWTEPIGVERDRRIAEAIGADKLALYEGELMLPPLTIRAQNGNPYSVFTPFYKAFAANYKPGAPIPAPDAIPAVKLPAAALKGFDVVKKAPGVDALGLTRNPNILHGGETAAEVRLAAFKQNVFGYGDTRDQLGMAGTSRLAADLHFGCLSPRTIWCEVAALKKPASAKGAMTNGKEQYLRQLVWREFGFNILAANPHILQKPFQPKFEGFPYVKDAAGWTAWVQGTTGYPVVDASARQLLHEGFVHNRARMISASFLTKHLLIDYREGEAHYLKYLTEGDWALNNMGWQWSAGCGCDAQPYFRVFNPVLQGEKFDKDGDYVRKWVPELRKLPNKWIHKPWEAPKEVLAQAGITLGKQYPEPIVEHTYARKRFLRVSERAIKFGGAGGKSASDIDDDE